VLASCALCNYCVFLSEVSSHTLGGTHVAVSTLWAASEAIHSFQSHMWCLLLSQQNHSPCYILPCQVYACSVFCVCNINFLWNPYMSYPPIWESERGADGGAHWASGAIRICCWPSGIILSRANSKSLLFARSPSAFSPPACRLQNAQRHSRGMSRWVEIDGKSTILCARSLLWCDSSVMCFVRAALRKCNADNPSAAAKLCQEGQRFCTQSLQSPGFCVLLIDKWGVQCA